METLILNLNLSEPNISYYVSHIELTGDNTTISHTNFNFVLENSTKVEDGPFLTMFKDYYIEDIREIYSSDEENLQLRKELTSMINSFDSIPINTRMSYVVVTILQKNVAPIKYLIPFSIYQPISDHTVFKNTMAKFIANTSYRDIFLRCKVLKHNYYLLDSNGKMIKFYL